LVYAALCLLTLLLVFIPPGLTVTRLACVFSAACLLNFTAFYFFVHISERELRSIRKLINLIRKNKISSPEEIVLPENLYDLQEEIRAMYLRTQNDIDYLKKLERVRTEFLGNVSHELRTPIFAIQGFIETLLDGAINDSKVNMKFLGKAAHHTENLNNLLNDLIDISMIESGEMHLSFRYFRLIDLIKEIIPELLPEAEKKNLKLIVNPFDEKLQILADRNKLRQVFNNLILNAIKYTEEGSVSVIIEADESAARIMIKDTGIGISEKDIPRIFERFYRVDRDRSRAAGGTGLGLAIVKHIIEAHSSKVEVRSTILGGSEFAFRLKH